MFIIWENHVTIEYCEIYEHIIEFGVQQMGLNDHIIRLLPGLNFRI